MTHLLGQAEDISERKQAEERLRQAERLEAVGRLAGGVAHEFNSLLAVIGGFARHALDEAESESLRRDLRRSSTPPSEQARFATARHLQPRRGVAARVLDVNDVVERLEPMLRA